jgi:hypothetical protein
MSSLMLSKHKNRHLLQELSLLEDTIDRTVKKVPKTGWKNVVFKGLMLTLD